MRNKPRWYSILLIGLVLLLTSSVVGCTEPNTKEVLDAAYDEGYSEGYAAGYEDGSGIVIEVDYQQYFVQGNGYLAQERWNEAIDKYTKAIELNPEYTDAYIKRAIAYNETGDHYELAIWDCEAAVELDPLVKLDSSLASAYIQRGEYYAQFIVYESHKNDEEDFDRAVADFTRAVELDPRLAEAYKLRADCYVNYVGEYLGTTVSYDKTIADYTMAISLNPTNANYYYKRARAYDINDDGDKKIADFTMAIELDPTNASYYRSRGLAHMDISKYRAATAIADFTRAIELEPDYDFSYSCRGDAYVEQGSYDLAITDYTKAIELTTRSSSLTYRYNERGHAYMKKGDYDKAITDFTKAIELASYPSSTYYNNRALAYLEQHNYDLAIADSSKAIELYSECDDAYWTRGQAYVAIGEKEKALADFRECLRLTEDFEEKYFPETRERNELVRQEIEKLESD